ncbi:MULTISPECIES: 50S ribosomal protein L10 [Calditerrivibrio]|uniref:Large ribosomal subunit protein uL10 n=1 Tax=Calditerrivibrio nitroreducens (strain DSM 19672 / NBRC 101217 / Yu37-1) TaxID=768670 RepID=E4TEZ8_CALNY|nr:50S ribosomal protein L10 [Calditerrivibrio nitroreducens]ADR19438.1 LSU ribosomal protein L10P [Calditerrivibrio nitroreducens DSM 19672]
MKKSDKQLLVEGLKAKIEKANAIFLADYKGCTFPELTAIRSAIKSTGNDFRVVKNRLLKLALNANNITQLDADLKEQTTCTIVFGEPTEVAKLLKKFSKDFKKFEIRSGYFEGQRLSKDDVIALADLPSREELLGRMLGSINAPVRNFVSLLANVPRSLLNVLNAIKDKKN